MREPDRAASPWASRSDAAIAAVPVEGGRPTPDAEGAANNTAITAVPVEGGRPTPDAEGTASNTAIGSHAVTTVSDAAGAAPAGDPGSEGPHVSARGWARRAALKAARLARAAAGTATYVGWKLVKGTAVAAFRYRVTGLAAEAAFFALLSLPPLVIGLVGTMGHFRSALGADTVLDIRTWLIERSQTVLTGQAVESVVVPLIDEVIKGGSPDIVSVSFLISLWAGSRATNVYVDTITIAYGLSGIRGVIRTRLRAFFLYLVGLLVMLILIPLLVAGPALVRRALPESAGFVLMFYWPVVVSLSIMFLAMLYHMSVPVRTAWWREVPGAVVALVMWIVGSVTLRLYLTGSLSGVSVYGSLSAAIAVLAWLYVAALAVLIGAALNAEIDRLWPSAGTARARAVREQRVGDEDGTNGKNSA
ncbi:YihY/virulence factor BrkB family protein [Actinomadura rubrisoli]|uniref:YihY/virulence factor BrkB family protein n=1 Tax=Actinomadura rubrisoli TaxID=2530368 RepID=A0A4R5B3A4_9ACTN|nr:YihY/virulence factor BrkB family protein [Actinomadura rubrisoli]